MVAEIIVEHGEGVATITLAAAIRGGAVGAGVNLAFATDLRIVAREARIASGFLPIGLHPGGGHGVLLPWPAALELERGPQMWSLRRRDLAGGDA